MVKYQLTGIEILAKCDLKMAKIWISVEFSQTVDWMQRFQRASNFGKAIQRVLLGFPFIAWVNLMLKVPPEKKKDLCSQHRCRLHRVLHHVERGPRFARTELLLCSPPTRRKERKDIRRGRELIDQKLKCAVQLY